VLTFQTNTLDADIEFQNGVNDYYQSPNRNSNEQTSDVIVRVAFQYSPLNPADINSIEGRYPSPFSLPPTSNNNPPTPKVTDQSLYFPNATIPGSEAVGTVTHISSEYSDLQIGDLVIPMYPGLGTWRSSIVSPSQAFFRIGASLTKDDESSSSSSSSSSLDPLTLSTINTNPCTAYRLLHDFFPTSVISSLSKDQDGKKSSQIQIVQNGGASSVGLAVSQLAHHMGIQCISIVRQGHRSDSQFQDLCSFLVDRGKNSLVLHEERLIQGEKDELRKAIREMEDLIPSDPRSETDVSRKPILGLNCVGGESLTVMTKLLEPKSTIVTYGGMSQRPLTIPTGQFIFRQLQFCGYWHSAWLVQNAQSEERRTMMTFLLDMVQDQKLVLGERRVLDLEEVKKALHMNALPVGDDTIGESFLKQKIVFQCS